MGQLAEWLRRISVEYDTRVRFPYCPPRKEDVMSQLDMEKLPFTIGIIGSRSFADNSVGRIRIQNHIGRFVGKTKHGTVIVSGGARGVDSWAVTSARSHGRTAKEFLPDPNIPTPARFFIRNKKLVDYIASDGIEGAIIAFADVGSCRGTMHAVRLAKKQNVPVMLLNFNERGILQGVEYYGRFDFTDD